MLKNYNISFEPGNMLTIDMLRTMYESPKEIQEHIFKDYSNGIISGMDIKEENGILIITSGIYKSAGNLFILDKDWSSEDSSFKEGKNYVVYIESDRGMLKTYSQMKENVIINRAEIKVSLESDMDNKEKIILCEFKGKPKIPKNCEELIYGIFYVLNFCHSCYKEPVYHQLVFRIIYNKLCEKDNKHPFDYMLMSEIAKSGIIPLAIIKQYITETFGFCNKLESESLFKKFVEAIEKLELKVYTSDYKEKPKNKSEKEDSERIIVF